VDTLRTFVDLILHLDKHLDQWSAALGPWVYVLLFAIVFCETGLVVTPFLPGDSLLFACGVLGARPDSGIHVVWLMGVLLVAAILGDAVNYAIGGAFGRTIVEKKPRWLNPQHIERTQAFYEKHGGKTIVFARFIPIVRTFAPFVAGMGRMGYQRFALFNVLGAIAWVVGLIALGYRFAGTELVQKNFKLVILAIIVISILPAVIEFLRARSEAKTEGSR
jgi:membrane-associated protein